MATTGSAVGRKGRRAGLISLLIILATPASVVGQSVQSLASECSATDPSAAGPCLEAAVTVQAVQGILGLMSGLGSEIPGSAGTLGRRLGTSPRVALSGRVGFAQGSMPDLSDPGGLPSRESTFLVPTLHGSIALGVFDGFKLIPTVGGFLSLDLVGGVSTMFLPSGEGFDGQVGSLAVGARLGLLRESFTVPGVSVSVAHRWLGTTRVGDVGLGDETEVTVGPSVTSVRATVGKDLLSVGFLVGVGWDRYRSEASAIVRTEDGPGGHASADAFASDRVLVFGGASLNLLILQLSTELGWAGGFDAVPGYTPAPHDPTAGTPFGSLAFRLTI